MQEYREKIQTVLAERWFPEASNTIEGVCACSHAFVGGVLHVHTFNGNAVALTAGDWIIKFANSTYTVYTHDQFQLYYELIE